MSQLSNVMDYINKSSLQGKVKKDVTQEIHNQIMSIDVGIKRYCEVLEGPVDLLTDKSLFPNLEAQVNFWTKLGAMDNSELQVANYFMRKGQKSQMVAYIEAPRERGLGKEEENSHIQTRAEIFDEKVLKKVFEPIKKVAKYGFGILATGALVMHNHALKETVDLLQSHLAEALVLGTTVMGVKKVSQYIGQNTFYNFNVRDDINSSKRENKDRDWQLILDNSENIPQRIRQSLIALDKKDMYDILEIKDNKKRSEALVKTVREFNPETHRLQTFFNSLNVKLIGNPEKAIVNAVRAIGEFTGVKALSNYKKEDYKTEAEKEEDIMSIRSKISDMRNLVVKSKVDKEVKKQP